MILNILILKDIKFILKKLVKNGLMELINQLNFVIIFTLKKNFDNVNQFLIEFKPENMKF